MIILFLHYTINLIGESMANIKNFSGQILLRIENDNIKEFNGQIKYKISGNKVNDFYGRTLFGTRP